MSSPLSGRGGEDLAGVGARGMRAGGFPGNPGGLVVSILKTAGARAPAHQARGRGRRTWRPTERNRRCSDGTATRRQRSAGGWTARSRSASDYRGSGGIEPTRPRGGKGAPAGGTVGGTDGQHTEVGSRLNKTTTDSRTGQHGGGLAVALLVACWTSGYAPARVAKPSAEEPDAEGSSRQGCNPAGASPAVSIAQVGHVAMPHPGMGNHPGDAWCKRPGRPARRCCGGCNLGA